MTRSILAALFAVALTFALSMGAARAHDKAYIQAGTLYAVPGKLPLKNKTLIVEDGLITDIIDGFVDGGEPDHVIDLRGHFVMPGLMDMHVHIQGELGPDNDRERLRFSDSLIAMRSVWFAQKTLAAGFTTIRDLGGEPEGLYALRDAIEAGWIVGPRIIGGGHVGITGGHIDVDGMRPDLLAHFTAPTICDGPDDCRRATRRAIKFGADVIKIASTGGVLSDTDTGTGIQMADDEITAVVSTAHALGRRVAAHAHAAAGINAALRAGVDSIEHGSYINDDSIRLFKEKGAFLVPTLLAGDTVVQLARRGGLASDDIRAKALRVGQDMKGSLARAYKAGVKIAFGTDSGVSRHGINAQEAVLMAEAGMTNEDILVAATVTAATLINMSDTIGTLEKGKVADVIALTQSPLDNIAALQVVEFVMAKGRVFKSNGKQR